jgi:beta-glucanase (GH16 family)
MNLTKMVGHSILAMIRIGKPWIFIIGWVHIPIPLWFHGIEGNKLQATNNLEWYDPAAITTANGSLVITLEQKQTHNLNYQGGTLIYSVRQDVAYLVR